MPAEPAPRTEAPLPSAAPAPPAGFSVGRGAKVAIVLASLAVLALVGAGIVLGKDFVFALSMICVIAFIACYWLLYG